MGGIRMATNIAWAASLLAIGITTVLLAGSHLAGFHLSDTATRICGLIDLLALAVLSYSTVKKIKRKA